MMSHKDDVSSVLYGVLKNTLVGTIAVWVTRNGVRRVGWVRQGMIEGDNWSHTDDDLLSTTFKQIQEYLEGNRKSFDLDLDFSGATSFQKKVFKRLADIPYGRIVSYRDIAKDLGDPLSARAVGQAVRANPLPILVPCHRVVRSDGKLGGFSGGLHRTVALLGVERVDVEGPQPESKGHPEVLRLPL